MRPARSLSTGLNLPSSQQPVRRSGLVVDQALSRFGKSTSSVNPRVAPKPPELSGACPVSDEPILRCPGALRSTSIAGGESVITTQSLLRHLHRDPRRLLFDSAWREPAWNGEDMKLTGLVGLLRFEGVLAAILAATPLILLATGCRGSISAYHDMDEPRWFFIPFTAAALMLVTNSLVRADQHGHNALLGALLLGVVLADHDGASKTIHFAFAGSFFVLALAFVALMVAHYRTAQTTGTTSTLRRTALVTAALIVLTLTIGSLVLQPGLFWLESLGVWIIAAHYVYHSWWEVAHHDDYTEPSIVFSRAWPRTHSFIRRVCRPILRFWGWLNGRREAAIASVASTAQGHE